MPSPGCNYDSHDILAFTYSYANAVSHSRSRCLEILARKEMPLRALELFAGIGGGSLAIRAAGVRTAAYCELDPWNQKVLASNMRRGRLAKRSSLHSGVSHTTR